MPADPATVPTLTQKEIAEAYTVALTDTRWTDGTPWVDIAPVWRNQEVAFAHRIAALAAARVDHELKDKRDKVMHMHDLYDALGVEWGRDPFSAIAALKASRVDTAEVERRAARKALAECAAWLGKGESQPVRFDEDGRFLLAFERVNAFSDRYLAREYPAPAPRECVPTLADLVEECNATKSDDGRPFERAVVAALDAIAVRVARLAAEVGQ